MLNVDIVHDGLKIGLYRYCDNYNQQVTDFVLTLKYSKVNSHELHCDNGWGLKQLSKVQQKWKVEKKSYINVHDYWLPEIIFVGLTVQ